MALRPRPRINIPGVHSNRSRVVFDRRPPAMMRTMLDVGGPTAWALRQPYPPPRRPITHRCIAWFHQPHEPILISFCKWNGHTLLQQLLTSISSNPPNPALSNMMLVSVHRWCLYGHGLWIACLPPSSTKLTRSTHVRTASTAGRLCKFAARFGLLISRRTTGGLMRNTFVRSFEGRSIPVRKTIHSCWKLSRELKWKMMFSCRIHTCKMASRDRETYQIKPII